ncbi:DUF2059 domain-containing protein [Biomphalaria pfeifferi]|uniref:DUF2059 domain-containing protein n=1 Tax=Biomphalaria pfeifferi TaxID=112525 RepID=A0AAD8APM6_BIOPF|nr:DUF2059 domain-containing protein [Biomphalaria pfeifferi]
MTCSLLRTPGLASCRKGQPCGRYVKLARLLTPLRRPRPDGAFSLDARQIFRDSQVELPRFAYDDLHMPSLLERLREGLRSMQRLQGAGQHQAPATQPASPAETSRMRTELDGPTASRSSQAASPRPARFRNSPPAGTRLKKAVLSKGRQEAPPFWRHRTLRGHLYGGRHLLVAAQHPPAQPLFFSAHQGAAAAAEHSPAGPHVMSGQAEPGPSIFGPQPTPQPDVQTGFGGHPPARPIRRRLPSSISLAPPSPVTIDPPASSRFQRQVTPYPRSSMHRLFALLVAHHRLSPTCHLCTRYRPDAGREGTHAGVWCLGHAGYCPRNKFKPPWRESHPVQGEPSSAGQLDRLSLAAQRTFTPDRLRATATRSVARALDSRHLPALLDWYESSTGIEVTRLETASASLQKDPRATIINGSAQLQRSTPLRRQLIDEVIASTRASDASATIAIGVALAMQRGLAAATRLGARAADPQLRTQLENATTADGAGLRHSLSSELRTHVRTAARQEPPGICVVPAVTSWAALQLDRHCSHWPCPHRSHRVDGRARWVRINHPSMSALTVATSVVLHRHQPRA